MRASLIRSAKTVLPTVTVAAVGGYLFAQGAGVYAATDRDSGQELAATLSCRLPFTLAAWSGGMVLVYELFRSLWGGKPKLADPKPPAVDSEQLLLQLLEQAEAAEQRRSGAVLVTAPRLAADTQPPRDPLPLPDLHFPVVPPGS
jgi:hypothetical protein